MAPGMALSSFPPEAMPGHRGSVERGNLEGWKETGFDRKSRGREGWLDPADPTT